LEGITVCQGIQLIRRNVDLGLRLTEQRHNRFSGMTTNDRNSQRRRVLLANDGSNKRLGADNVERSDTEQTSGVKDASILEHLGGDGHGRVDGVGNDEEKGFGAVLSDAGDEVAHDAGVDLEQVVAGHAWFARNAGGDDDNVGSGEGVLHAVIFGQVTANNLFT
jgi:hypothetical protein